MGQYRSSLWKEHITKRRYHSTLKTNLGQSKITKMSSLANVMKAADFAAKKHRDQRRKDPQQTPYINHPIGVANILANEGGIDDPLVLQAALLHDTVEDTDTTLDEVEEQFGKVKLVISNARKHSLGLIISNF